MDRPPPAPTSSQMDEACEGFVGDLSAYIPAFNRSGSSHRWTRSENIRNADSVTDAERLHDIEQKLHSWCCLSHYRDAEQDVAWLLDQLAERDARIAELEARLEHKEWMSSLP